MQRTCVALVSGGLDSSLATALMVRQGVAVVAFHAAHAFHPKTDQAAGQDALRQRILALGARALVVHDVTDELLQLVRNPRYGHGKRLNPCIDCRMLALTHAKAVLEEAGADFAVTGEVVGQRPMSQRRDALRSVDKHARAIGLEGLLVRPLSARLLAPTRPETEGWIDRDALCDFAGRGRTPQLALAEELGITGFDTPAGGCLLTDKSFARRLQDLLDHDPVCGADDIRLLRVGRHYRLAEGTKLVVSRRDVENEELRGLTRAGDTCFLARDRPGALVLVRGTCGPETAGLAAGLAVHHSKHRREGRAAVLRWPGGGHPAQEQEAAVHPSVDPEELADVRVDADRS